MTKNSLDEIKKFYNDRFKENGDSIKSVGWGSVESQRLRFEVLLRNLDMENKTILDIGCGLGDLIPFLKQRVKNFKYIGLDISNSLINEARLKFSKDSHVSFYESDLLTFNKLEQIDISVLSGALTYKMEDNIGYAKEVLKKMFDSSKVAAAANFMSSYVDFKNEKNFHYPPEEIFSYGKSLSSKVNLFHDYPLYEFTIQILK